MQPVLKIEEINDELIILQGKRNQFEKVDKFTLKRLKNEVNKILPKDSLSAYMLLGIISVLEDDIHAVHENFKKALHLSKMLIVYHNYSVALANMGYYSQAFALCKNIEITSDKQFYNLLLLSSFRSGCFHEARLWIDKWDRCYPNENLDSQFPSIQFIEQVISFMDSKGVSDADLQKLIEVTFDVAQQQGIFTFKSKPDLSPDEDTLCFGYWIEVPVDVEIVVELNTQLASAIVEQCPPSIVEQSGFVPLFITVRDE